LILESLAGFSVPGELKRAMTKRGDLMSIISVPGVLWSLTIWTIAGKPRSLDSIIFPDLTMSMSALRRLDTLKSDDSSVAQPYADGASFSKRDHEPFMVVGGEHDAIMNCLSVGLRARD
jgi:hypothetical protein